MVLCPNCGAQVEGRFCARCGTAVSQAAAASSSSGYSGNPAGAPPPGAAYPTATPASTSGGLADNIAGLLCYAPFIGLFASIIFLVIEPYKNNRFVRFHAFQSLFLIGGIFVFNIAFQIVAAIMAKILSVFALLLIPVFLLLALGEFCIFLWLMYKAYSNEKWQVPVVGPLAEKQANS